MVGACCGDHVVVGFAMVACRVLVVSRVVVPVSSCRCSNVDVMWLLLILVFLRVVISALAIATRIEPIVVCRVAPVASISTESAMPAPLDWRGWSMGSFEAKEYVPYGWLACHGARREVCRKLRKRPLRVCARGAALGHEF